MHFEKEGGERVKRNEVEEEEEEEEKERKPNQQMHNQIKRHP